MRIEDFAVRLEDMTAKTAFDFISKPNRRDVFEYGERTGIVIGLRMARQLIDTMEAEEAEDGKVKR